MAIILPTFGGSAIFGLALHCPMVPHPGAVQRTGIFGQNGVLSLYGGSRGRDFPWECLFVAEDLYMLYSYEAILMNFADGKARTLTDNQGRVWPNVIFLGEYWPDPGGPKWTDTGVCLPYRVLLEGLT
jgi:hypothetical protein